MEIKNKLRGLLQRKKKLVEILSPELGKPKIEVPKEWLEQTPKPSTSSKTHSRFKPSKIHIPFLRTTKRVMAGLLLIINFIISQATLTSHPDTQPLFWLFLLNSFIILDYIWKTRRKEA